MIFKPTKIPRPFLLALLLPTIAVLGFTISEIHSFDLFWQLQSGKYIWQTKAFLYHDTFSLAEQTARYEHCWLHDLIVYLVYQLGGYTGLSIFKGLLLTATFFVLALTARQRSASIKSILLISFPAYLFTAWAWLARPQLWTFFFFALFVMILDRHLRKADVWVFGLVPLLVVWANLHAGAILVFPIMAAFLVGALSEHYMLGRRLAAGGLIKLGLTTGLIFPAICLTPYGKQALQTLIQAPKFGADTGGATHTFNVDWQLTTYAEHPWFYYAIVFIALLLLLQGRKARLFDVLLLGGLALMGLKLSRHTPFLFFAAAAVLPGYLDAVLEDCQWWPKKYHPFVRWALMVAMVCLLGKVSWATYKRQGFLQTGLREWYYPLAATEFIKEHQLAANLYNSYDWGGYLMWQLYPRYRVFWDGRQASAKMYQVGRQIGGGEESWQQLLDQYEVNTLVIKPLDIAAGARYRILDRLRTSDNWRLVLSNQNSLVFVRPQSVSPEWLKQYELPKENIDQTMLALGSLLVGEFGTNRYQVYWEAFRIFFARGENQLAWQNLQMLKQRAPKDIREAKIVRQYETVLTERLKN